MGEPESSRKNAREQICDRPCTDCRDHGSDSDRGEISETGDRNDRGDDCNADFRVNADGSERFSRLLGETGNKSFMGSTANPEFTVHEIPAASTAQAAKVSRILEIMLSAEMN